MKKLFSSFLVIAILLLIIEVSQTGCANIIPPGGGPRDSLPPKLITALPKDSSFNTQAKKIAAPSSKPPQSRKIDLYNLEAFAQFEPEIDLHIQALMPGYARLDKKEILRIQMKHFEAFMERAIRLGASRVFIIHGIGEGKLKESVSERLRVIPFVRKFKNEYHHKYGYGATEVWIE